VIPVDGDLNQVCREDKVVRSVDVVEVGVVGVKPLGHIAVDDIGHLPKAASVTGDERTGLNQFLYFTSNESVFSDRSVCSISISTG
jgi:hypothetical protein